MSASVVSFPAWPRRPLPPPPRRLLVRIAVASADCHEPYGLCRPASIREDDLLELIACAKRLEARR
jgi:hypothetical protein